MRVATTSFLGAILVGVFVAVAPVPASAEATCAEAQKQIHAWIEANAANLPTKLKDMNQHPMAYRKAIFATLSAEQKAALWQEHIRNYVEERPRLSASQAIAIEMARSLFTPEFFRNPGDASSAAAEAAVFEAFGADEARAILATLGSVEAPNEGPPTLAPFCQCSRESPYCGSFYCRAGGCTKQSGCGTGWSHECDGLCGT
ncbi:bacteriocin fulvocin C-related protein [Corallococcus exiguus]|uniref:bacteriocin fulvocin C-related protein n=1 Tax=Corallococcus exiguus TaxID=83462 RepID=UPI00149420F0|nr:bacteriocin fulvocin C-related protein [Corallococcus exiguus]NPD29206.1 bacteriocin fulvocin C-related protein [Corallococcus exiguus]